MFTMGLITSDRSEIRMGHFKLQEEVRKKHPNGKKFTTLEGERAGGGGVSGGPEFEEKQIWLRGEARVGRGGREKVAKKPREKGKELEATGAKMRDGALHLRKENSTEMAPCGGGKWKVLGQ